jgi:hypothetical protein
MPKRPETKKKSNKQAASKPTPRCALCGREKPLSFHHLIPKAVHHRRRIQRLHSKKEMRTRGIKLCKLCHSGIHDLISEKDLADKFATREALLENEAIAKHVDWVKKQK